MLEELVQLADPLSEWVEIQVGQHDHLFWIGGLYSSGGAKRATYDFKFIKYGFSSTREEALSFAKVLAKQASVTRLLLDLRPVKCEFVWSDD